MTKTDADGKKGAGRLLLIDALHTDGLEDRQWRLTAETPEQVRSVHATWSLMMSFHLPVSVG